MPFYYEKRIPYAARVKGHVVAPHKESANVVVNVQKRQLPLCLANNHYALSAGFLTNNHHVMLTTGVCIANRVNPLKGF